MGYVVEGDSCGCQIVTTSMPSKQRLEIKQLGMCKCVFPAALLLQIS
ncbi:MAG: hypothetical protein U0L67_07610 [Paludibacteraceae bacterium]|nr:hypothetical protein [Paludibacteraceae bacterium]